MPPKQDTLRQILTQVAVDSLIGNYNFDYKGTLPLDFETFPEVPSPQWEGDVSNIITQLEGSDDIGWYLFPTMIGGELLEEEYKGGDVLDFLNRNLGGKHFGKFSSYEEGMRGDTLIHDYFNYLKLLKEPSEE